MLCTYKRKSHNFTWPSGDVTAPIPALKNSPGFALQTLDLVSNPAQGAVITPTPLNFPSGFTDQVSYQGNQAKVVFLKDKTTNQFVNSFAEPSLATPVQFQDKNNAWQTLDAKALKNRAWDNKQRGRAGVALTGDNAMWGTYMGPWSN